MPEWTVAELASRVSGEVHGNGAVVVRGVNGVREAEADELSYVADRQYRAAAIASSAGAMVTGPEELPDLKGAQIVCPEPEKAFYALALLFAPPPQAFPPGVAPSAVVHASADIGSEVHIGPGAVIEEGCIIGERSRICAGTYIGRDCHIDADCLLYPQVVVREHTRIGARVILHSHSTIGADGFGFYTDSDGINQKIPQTGTVCIEDDVEIGANVTVDRARFGMTRIGKNTKIDNLVQIAHNCDIGPSCMIAAQAGFSGSTLLGHHSLVGGQVGTVGHLEIGPHTVLGARTGVTKSIDGGAMYSGFPVRPAVEDRKSRAALARLPEMRAELRRMQERLRQLENPHAQNQD